MGSEVVALPAPRERTHKCAQAHLHAFFIFFSLILDHYHRAKTITHPSATCRSLLISAWLAGDCRQDVGVFPIPSTQGCLPCLEGLPWMARGWRWAPLRCSALSLAQEAKRYLAAGSLLLHAQYLHRLVCTGLWATQCLFALVSAVPGDD